MVVGAGVALASVHLAGVVPSATARQTIFVASQLRYGRGSRVPSPRSFDCVLRLDFMPAGASQVPRDFVRLIHWHGGQ